MDRKLNQLGDIDELELFHDICPVGFYRTGADEKNVWNLFGGMPFSDHLEHFALPIGKFTESRNNQVDFVLTETPTQGQKRIPVSFLPAH